MQKRKLQKKIDKLKRSKKKPKGIKIPNYPHQESQGQWQKILKKQKNR